MPLRTSINGLVKAYSGSRIGCRHACLYDFDVDGDQLKHNHKSWLDRNVAPLLKENATQYTVQIVGTASRTGTEAHNAALGIQRAISVVRYLQASTPGALLFPYSRGESMADPKHAEAANDRAVWVTVKQNQVGEKRKREHDPILKSLPRQVRPAPPNPPIDAPGPSKTEDFAKGTKPFQIKLKSGTISEVEVYKCAGLGHADLVFTIRDVEEKWEGEYSFSGRGKSLSLGMGGSPLSRTTFSDGNVWNEFEDDRSKAITDFVGMGVWSANLDQSTYDLQIRIYPAVICFFDCESVRIPKFKIGPSQGDGLPSLGLISEYRGEFELKGHWMFRG